MEKKDIDKFAGFSLYDLVETDNSYFSSVEPNHKLEEILNRLSTGRLPFNPDVIKKFSTHLGLGFDPNRNAEGNVCFVNHDDVRPEYRLNFGPMDLADYLYVVLHDPTSQEIRKDISSVKSLFISYPKDPAAFWKLVQKGSKLRQNRSSCSKQ